MKHARFRGYLLLLMLFAVVTTILLGAALSLPLCTFYQQNILDAKGRLSGYTHDCHHVYYGGDLVASADPRTFRVIYTDDAQSYAIDRYHVFDQGYQLPGADPRSFRVIMGSGEYATNYAEDAERVYFNDHIIIDADPTTFIVYADSPYAKDKYRVYSEYAKGQISFSPLPIKGADSSTFVVLLPAAVSPGNCGLDYATSSECDAQDQAHKYYAGSVVPLLNRTLNLGG